MVETIREKYNTFAVGIKPYEKLIVIKQILKLMKLSKYYKHIYHIYKKLGNNIISFNQDFELKLHHFFNLFCNNFYKNIKVGRKNFFNFYYFLGKLFVLLNKPEYVFIVVAEPKVIEP